MAPPAMQSDNVEEEDVETLRLKLGILEAKLKLKMAQKEKKTAITDTEAPQAPELLSGQPTVKEPAAPEVQRLVLVPAAEGSEAPGAPKPAPEPAGTGDLDSIASSSRPQSEENIENLDVSEDSNNAGLKQAIDFKQARTTGKDKKRKMNAPEQLIHDCTSTSSSNASTVTTVLIDDPAELAKSPKQKHENKKSNGDIKTRVPVVPHYEFQAISSGSENKIWTSANCTTKQHGLFATEDIDQGTRIISEKSLILLEGFSGGDEIEGLMQKYAILPEHEKDRVWELDPSDFSVSPTLEALDEMMKPILERTVQLLIKPKEDRTKVEELELKESGAMLEHAIATLRVAARWCAGCRSLIDFPEDERYTLHEDFPTSGLFVETARLRHSCVPNCYAHYNSGSGRMTVHTTRAIASGEELTLSSISGIHYLDAEERAEELETKYGIKCNCEACNPSHAEFKKHEDARLRVAVRAKILGQFLTQLEIVDSNQVLEDLCLSSDVRPERQPNQVELEEYAQTIIELTKDLKVTGCEDLELIRWQAALIDRIQPRLAEWLPDQKRSALWKSMLGRANECELLAKKCLGENTKEFQAIRNRREQIAALIENAEKRAEALEVSRRRIK